MSVPVATKAQIITTIITIIVLSIILSYSRQNHQSTEEVQSGSDLEDEEEDTILDIVGAEQGENVPVLRDVP